METFTKLFGSLLSLVYHCFDRLVILAYLPLLTRAEHVVYLFRDVNGISPITPEVLRQRTTEYRRWVESFALCHALPIEWAEKGVSKEEQVLPYLQRLERKNQFGVYFIYRSMEIGPTFRSSAPSFRPQTPITASCDGNAAAIPILLFLHPRQRTGADRLVCWLFPAFPDQLLAQRPQLHRTAAAAPGHGLP